MADKAIAKPVLKSWLAIKEMFDNEYFHGAWTVQEVGLADRARILCGSRELYPNGLKLQHSASSWMIRCISCQSFTIEAISR
jgi:hypothetical protein